METAEQLEKAADILETGGHCKNLLEDDAGRHCAVGALIVARSGMSAHLSLEGEKELTPPLRAIVDHLGLKPEPSGCPCCIDGFWTAVVNWNNHPDRTGAEVVDAFRHAAKNLRNEAVPA